jgi:nucleotide-binding universal stress UspA family protein
MAKILVALNDNDFFNEHLVMVMDQLFPSLNDHLFTGLLVKDYSYVNKVSNYVGEPALADYMPYSATLISEEDQKKADVISKFEYTARKFDISHEIYNDFKLTSHELVKHTTYADLLVLNYEVFYNYITRKPDTTILYQILKGSKCPVLILPTTTQKIDSLIFTYDGKESSVFAIRSFSHLFASRTREKSVSVLTVVPDAEEEIINEKLLLDFVKQHYKDVGLQLLTGNNIGLEISNFAENTPNPIVVMGAYGRSHISNLFLPSVARHILERSNLPIFIAHR